MRAYAKVSPVFWTRGSGKRLRGDGVAQAVAFHLATGPQANMVGLYHVALPTIAHETGHDEDAVRAALERIAAAGFAYYDEEAELAYVPNALEIEIGPGKRLSAGDNRRKGILNQLATLGPHRFVHQFWDRYDPIYDLGPRPFKAPSEPLPSPSEGPCTHELDGTQVHAAYVDGWPLKAKPNSKWGAFDPVWEAVAGWCNDQARGEGRAPREVLSTLLRAFWADDWCREGGYKPGQLRSESTKLYAAALEATGGSAGDPHSELREQINRARIAGDHDRAAELTAELRKAYREPGRAAAS